MMTETARWLRGARDRDGGKMSRLKKALASLHPETGPEHQ